jgi:hypothetical protein
MFHITGWKKSMRVNAIEYVFRGLIPERFDHDDMIAWTSCYSSLGIPVVARFQFNIQDPALRTPEPAQERSERKSFSI